MRTIFSPKFMSEQTFVYCEQTKSYLGVKRMSFSVAGNGTQFCFSAPDCLLEPFAFPIVNKKTLRVAKYEKTLPPKPYKTPRFQFPLYSAGKIKPVSVYSCVPFPRGYLVNGFPTGKLELLKFVKNLRINDFVVSFKKRDVVAIDDFYLFVDGFNIISNASWAFYRCFVALLETYRGNGNVWTLDQLYPRDIRIEKETWEKEKSALIEAVVQLLLDNLK